MARLRRRGALTLRIRLLLVVVDVLVVRFLLGIVLDAGINLLGRHVVEAVQNQGVGRWHQPVGHERGVDGEIAGNVPAAPVAVLAAREVRQRAMQRLVRQHELGLLEGKLIDVVAVVVERFGVGGGGAAPLGIALDQRQAQHQRAEERLVNNEPGARGGELGFDVGVHGNGQDLQG